MAAVRAVRVGNGCTLRQDPDLGLDTSEQNARDLPELRGVLSLRRRGLLTAQTASPSWLDAGQLYDAVRASQVLVAPDNGYDTAGCFGGHLFEVQLPSEETRVVLVAGGPEVSNDHHPYYEVVFRRSGAQLTVDRTRVAYYDIAGIEGFEWPLLHGFIAVVVGLIAGAVFSGIAAARWMARRLRD